MITPAIVAIAAGRPVPTPGSVTEQQYQMWIADAELLIEERIENLGLSLALTDLHPGRLDYVIREAVKAHILRPDDATQVEVAVDDGRVSRRYTSGDGRVTILDRWWKMLGLEDTSDTGPHSIDLAVAAKASAGFGPLYDGPLHRRLR